jgi:tetratricopeptide (TPR) repeat protein
MTRFAKRVTRFVAALQDAPAGRAIAEEALLLPASERRGWLAGHADGGSYPVLNAILDRAHGHLDDAPREALALTDLVLDVLYRSLFVDRDELRNRVHGRAWYERANAALQAGALVDAFRAYHHATLIFKDSPAAAREIAAAKRGVALLQHHFGESEDALRLLGRVAAVFRFHDDAAGVVECDVCEGVIDLETGRVARARESFEHALHLAARLGDEKTVARVHLHAGKCALAEGNRTAALRSFARAIEFFEREELHTDRKRVAWAMAQLMVDNGFADGAIHALQDVALHMDASGFRTDAALARRDMAEVLILTDQSEQAAEIARGVLDTLARAGMFREAARTLSLLSTADTWRERNHS